MQEADTQAAATVARRILLDLDRCVGCKTCAAACYHSHHEMPIVQHARVAAGALPLLCRQCEVAPCVDACPSGALQREPSGVVKRSLLLCWGCRSCILACPFGVLPSDLTRHAAAKCDLCEDRTASEDGGVPRCVAACPSGALVFADERDTEQAPLGLLGGRTTGESPYKRR